ncbi:hypothetical protein PB01_08050 [Psychrobacillus glaciei]|uniref:Uncharacterized protein n=1 Tax=Psychrobacillus glaciei TaxID=2283160 RepID=A0A5J6SRJ0_9BACI|nr:hypothetical protein [Psychrobacillus glaciei]QFF98787.1 hypothetical protein PB01_08050 [Psychrobacillus glaciei]
MEDKRWIELHGKLKKILNRDANNITVLFNDMSIGNLTLTIPKSNVFSLSLKVHKYYNLFAELKGVTHVNNGRVYTNNILKVVRVVNEK